MVSNTIYRSLRKIYPDIICEYNEDPRYPFRCDFYIPRLDLFIEIQGHWTHGKSPFDKDNPRDVLRLNKLFAKSNNSKFYKNALDIWTYADVGKREMAMSNALNYIEVFNTNDKNICGR